MASASVHGNMVGHGHGPSSMGSISTAPGLSLAVMLQQTAYNGIINCFCHGHASRAVQLPFSPLQPSTLRPPDTNPFAGCTRTTSQPAPASNRSSATTGPSSSPPFKITVPQESPSSNLLQTSCPSISSLAPRLGCHTNSLLMLHPASITILDAHSSASSSTILRPRFSSRPSPSSRPADDSRPHRQGPMIHQ